MGRPVIAVALSALMTVSQDVAGVQLVLLDGQRIAGQELERHENEFIVETAQGARLVVPRQLVAAIQLSGEGPTRRIDLRGDSHGVLTAGRSPTDTQGMAGAEATVATPPDSLSSAATDPESRGSRLRPTESAILGSRPDLEGAASSVALPPSTLTPTPAEQLAAFGHDPAIFQRPPVDPIWRYEDVLGYERDVTQFRPSHWYRSKVDPNWRYEDVLGNRTDVTQFAPAQWHPAPVPARWYPTDGWSSAPDAGKRDQRLTLSRQARESREGQREDARDE